MKNRLKYYYKIVKQHQRNIEAVIIILVIAAVLIFGPKGDKELIKEEKENKKQITVEKNAEEKEKDKKQKDINYTESTRMYADISGCVNKPGIYSIKRDTRLFELIDMAGGLTDEADYNGFNQAERIEDGDKIIIPALGQVAEDGSIPVNSIDPDNGKININTADSTALQEIPGVGPSTADKIIEYRQNNGRFHNIEDLMNISGIGEKTFSKMQDKITV